VSDLSRSLHKMGEPRGHILFYTIPLTGSHTDEYTLVYSFGASPLRLEADVVRQSPTPY